MTNSMIESILRHKKIIPVVIALTAIGAYVIPANSLALGAAITGSGNVLQSVTQSHSITATNTGKYGGAFADNNLQVNLASNSAFVHLISGGGSGSGGGSIKDSGNVLQSIDQSNSITATNTGDFGTASASGNTQVNDATNNADVHIHNSGGHHSHSYKISDSGNVAQSITQSNSISADNSGASGSAHADNNVQVNDAHNNAHVHISNSGSYHHHGDKISDSGNVAQSISQTNSISASNSGDHGSASASGNTQINTASNNADVHIHNK